MHPIKAQQVMMKTFERMDVDGIQNLNESDFISYVSAEASLIDLSSPDAYNRVRDMYITSTREP